MTDEATEIISAEQGPGTEDKVKAADIEVVRGNPADAEIAALVAALSALASKAEAESLTTHNRWGQPVDKLRYSAHSWQLVTLLQRTKLAR
ncbi:acyl-CoA carboxylase epsilon subunit [Mycobacterium sp. NPDC050853]|uniref:acyl-CoA carboxylase epsilon subunit n=1 Tax=Mycobacteriaceae TaxID=1762 RepID=UPI0015DD95C5|nr:hypothetical protein [Mycobacteroides sp. LB1]